MSARVTPLVSLAEAQAFLRLESGHEEALLAGLIRTATEVCEAFLDRPVLTREFKEQVRASGEWQPLATMSITSVRTVKRVSGFSAAVELRSADYEVDLDASGRTWLRLTGDPARGRVEVEGTAGLAEHQHDVPEPIRHGVLRMVGHLYAARDGDGGEPPAMVTALWRPYRQLRLSR